MTSNQPDPTELFARQYLEDIGYTDIVYQPDGNVPPDFLLDHKIAVEVRRLNENSYLTTGKPEGLETLRLMTWYMTKSVITELSIMDGQKTWAVSIEIANQISFTKRRGLKKQIRDQLLAFHARSHHTEDQVQPCDGLFLRLFPLSQPLGDFFILATQIDHRHNAWINQAL
jgi:uncharacterized protein YifN (PemK superfamily)